jgi:hypothetical protein
MHDIGTTRLETAGGFGQAQEYSEVGTPLNEMQEVELATELLEVSNEAELEQFLGDVISAIGGAARRFASSDTGQALGGILKDAARQALPAVGQAVGQWVSPRYGGQIGQTLATGAGRLLGLELEGLSAEDRDFEIARQFVRFAGAASQAAARNGTAAPGPEAARAAAISAARRFAPGLVPMLRGRSGINWPRSGTWVRQGRTIILNGG